MDSNTVRLVSSFYKYKKVGNPIILQQKQLALCELLNLKGRILIGEEGINGSVFGLKSNVEKYKKELRKNKLFKDIEFKEQETQKQAFRKLFARVRKEVVNFGVEVNLKNSAPFITPRQLKETLDRKDNIVLLDVRNNYEVKIGKFRDARTLSMRNFRDLPKYLNEIEDLKEKRIVAYCTGGIRCEKATAFLKENGFKKISQLKGGILKFGEEFPDTYWEGKCFVFDDRIAIDINHKNSKKLNECVWCLEKCDDYVNCHNISCDKLFICCENCKALYNKSCSNECLKASKRRKEYPIIIGQL